jgi:HK97 family phage major capsid protein
MSNRLKALREQKAEKFEKLEGITGKAAADKNRPLTEDERKEFAVLEREISALAEDIRMEEFVLAQKAGAAIPAQPEKRTEKMDATQFHRAGKLMAFKGTDADKNAYRAGQWLAACFLGSEKSAQFCRDNGIAITRAHSEGTNTTGGFVVPSEMERTIIDLREEYGTFRSFAKVVPMASDTFTQPRRTSGLTAYWTAEAAAATESSKGWDNVSLVAKKLMCYSLFSTELAEDAFINVADDLANEMAYAFAVAEDAAGWNGDGTPTYGNIRGVRPKIIDGTHTKSAINATSAHNTFAEIDATDLMNLMAALPKYALRNAKFYCSQVAFATVFARLTAAAGGNTMDTLAGPQNYRYQGYPIVIDQTLPGTSGSTDFVNTAMLFFGDLSLAALMGTRRGITVKTSEHFKFTNDQVAITGTERIDINVANLGDTSVAGPIIAMVGA